MKRTPLLAAVVLAALLSPLSGRAFGVILERELMREIYNSVSVMRYLHQQIHYLEETLEMVEATLDLTRKQYDAQKALVEEEEAKGEAGCPIRLEVFQITLRRLEESVENLLRYNLTDAYRAQIASIRTQMTRYEIQLEAKTHEFLIHIGRDPGVEVDFEAEVARFIRRRMDVTYLTLR